MAAPEGSNGGSRPVPAALLPGEGGFGAAVPTAAAGAAAGAPPPRAPPPAEPLRGGVEGKAPAAAAESADVIR